MPCGEKIGKIVGFILLNLITIIMIVIYSILKSQTNTIKIEKTPEITTTLNGEKVTHLKEPQQIPKDGWQRIKETIDQWHQACLNKWKSIYIEIKNLPKNESNQQENMRRGALFGDFDMICRNISSMIKYKVRDYDIPESMENWDTVLLVSDENDKPQSIALYDSTKNKLVSLITHPDNLQDTINQNQVRGTATKIVNYLKRISSDQKRDLILDSVGTAVSFYEHLGFKRNTAIPVKENKPIPMIYPYVLA